MATSNKKEETKIEETKKKVVKTPKAGEKKETPKKTTTSTKKTTTSSKKETPKKTTKVSTKKVPAKKIIDPRTGKAIIAGKKEPVKKEPVKKEPVVVVEEKKKTKKKTTVQKKTSKELTIEVPKKEPVELERPTPKKTKELTKDEKVLYKQLAENFTFVINMANVIEDRTMDRKQISDLALGELHVIETVNKYNNKPMTLIAKKEHVTVGALTTCVNRLVQKGYLLRTRDEMDHRVILLSVTQKAKKVLKVHDKFHEDILGLTLEKVKLTQAADIMAQIARVLEVYYDPSLLLVKEAPKKNGKKK